MGDRMKVNLFLFLSRSDFPPLFSIFLLQDEVFMAMERDGCDPTPP
jgi:hypothetical protein